MSKQRTFKRTFKLDTVFNRNTTSDSNHWAGTTVKGWKVIDTNNDNFKLSIVADPVNGAIEGIPMGDIRVHNYETMANNAVLENDLVQPGVYVTVLFSVEDRIDDTNVKRNGSNTVSISGGNGFSNDKAAVSNTPSQIFAADDSRTLGQIHNTILETIYVGSQSKISASDFADTCIPIKPDSMPFNWDLADSLWWRTVGAGPFYPVILTKGK